MVKFLNLAKLYEEVREDVLPEILEVLDKTQYVLGDKVAAFEKDFAEYCQTEQCVGVSNGTAALHVAMQSCGIGPGDEVITTPMSFMATTSSILMCGATPVYVDIDPKTWNLDPAGIEKAITPKTKAILPVHLYGQMANMESICRIAQKHNLLVIEDAAQAHGATWKGRKAGSWGDMACFSFYPGKNLGAFGEAGGIVSCNELLAARARSLRDWGQEGKYNHVLPGGNARMEGIQGAVLGVKLKHLERWTARRRDIAAMYLNELSGVSRIVLPTVAPEANPVWHIFAVQTEDRLTLQEELKDKGIDASIHYPQAIHELGCYKDLPFAQVSMPVSEHHARHELSLPMCPMLTDEEVMIVVRRLKA